MDKLHQLTIKWLPRGRRHKISSSINVVVTSVGQTRFNIATLQQRSTKAHPLSQADQLKQLKISNTEQQHNKLQIFQCLQIIFYSKGKRSPNRHRRWTLQLMIINSPISTSQMPCQAKLVKMSRRNSAHPISTPFKQIKIKKTIIDKR